MKFLVWEARIYDLPEQRRQEAARAELIEDSSAEEAVRSFAYHRYCCMGHIDGLSREGGVIVQAQGGKPVRYEVKAIESVEFKVKKVTK